MCGIAGIVSKRLGVQEREQQVQRMLQKIIHRGPEASATYSHEAVTLGHNRLKIIDLSDEANQPFEYNDVVIAFNGEVYNYVELKQELQQAGYTFRTQGDTEVILAAYRHWGEDCVTRFVGMWAFALWDKQKQKLFCSRDRFGIKPFYYIASDESLFWGSEYKALRECSAFNNHINEEQLKRTLQLLWSVYRTETFYTYVKNLEPAHNLVWHNGQISVYRYWDVELPARKNTLNFQEKKEKFEDLFRQSLKLHSRSDVPNGTCLSGGLDSSAISSMYCTLLPDTPIKSFSIYYEDDVDERPFVREVVKKYPSIQPHYYSPTEQDVAEAFYRMAYHADVPVTGSSFLSQYFLMQLAQREGVTVVIDGQGSDEYLGGYLHSFYRVAGDMIANFQWSGANRLLSNLAEREGFSAKKKADYLLKSLVSVAADENRIYNLEYAQVKNLLSSDYQPLYFEQKTTDRFDNFLYHLLLNTHLQTLLHFEDRNSMAFSLESRVPFLDHRLVEFAFTLQREDRINNKAETKYILREALKGVLPAAVYERKDKKGFVTPGEVKWLNGPLRFLLEVDFNRMPWLNRPKAEQLISDYRKGDTSKAALVWRICCIHYWLKNFA